MSPKRIEIVEDEAIIAMDMAQRLREFGYEVVGTAASGEQALALASSTRPDLIMMDVVIKGEVDGIEAARRIRERLDVPVIFLTAYGDEATLARAREVAPYAYLMKPFRADELRTTIAVVLDKHALEKELQRYRDRLETMVEERTAALSAALKDMESLTHTMAHDLRTPVRAMHASARILLEDFGAALPAGARERIERIAATSVTMGELVDGLLELERIGRHEPQRTSLDVKHLACEVWADIAAREPRRVVDFAVGAVPRASADRTLVRVVLHELLGNAFKFARGAQAPRVRVGATTEDGRVVYFVADSGAGFEQAHFEKACRPLHRLHRDDEFEGVGIGLAKAKRAIERLGGSLGAESQPGRGATLYFTLGDD